ncbi:MAG TPA: ADP-forming succinate--CoA ligase subunit beta [Candidatus Caldiarchaeum subterraneum]|uniref:Succinate--CoA ligase [ADP-forming] subunit beta n=1 Tax=Caldiarchaeum subterraneum TaxID=311458 RepID=A0A832ZVG8_CALS0|nr:ADP-forming succinate--CoA ligase subunit beta [Candidatus Caldarchaeum subterraneum]
MKLHEYEAKELFHEYGIPAPRFAVARSSEEAKKLAREMGGKVVVKAQVLVAGRGRAGGIRFAENPDEAASHAAELLGSRIKGEQVEMVLITPYTEMERELYLSIIVDRSRGVPVILASPEGGVEIEELARASPEKLLKLPIDPLVGLRNYHQRRVAKFLNLDDGLLTSAMDMLERIYRLFKDYDCELVEINPLAVTKENKLEAVDAKILIDDNALFRQRRFERPVDPSSLEEQARRMGFAYVELDGDIGIIGNGAGLTMATMDVVYEMGGRPANFLDIGGGASEDVVDKAATLLLRHPKVRVLFVNILGGITRCDEVAKGLVKAVKNVGATKKVVVRMMGTNEEEGRKILEGNGLYSYDNMEEAAKKATELAIG